MVISWWPSSRIYCPSPSPDSPIRRCPNSKTSYAPTCRSRVERSVAGGDDSGSSTTKTWPTLLVLARSVEDEVMTSGEPANSGKRLASHDIVRIFFFNDPAPPEIYTLSLHDALPI